MAGVELLIILSVAAFYFAVVARCKGFDFLVPDSELGKCFFKECQRFVLTVAHFICKFQPLVCLNTLNGIGKLLYYMLWKLCGRVCTLLLERLEIPESAVLVNLSGGLVADCSGCNTVLQRILNYCFLKPHVLCYLMHSG